MRKGTLIIILTIFISSVIFGQSSLDSLIAIDSLAIMEEIGIAAEPMSLESSTGLSLIRTLDGRETGEYLFSSGLPNEVVHAGSYVFIANSSSIEILSIADPTNPQHLLSYPTNNAMGIAIQSGLIFVTSKTRGLDIYSYDVESNQLEHISNFHHDSRLQYRYVAVSGCYAYISCVSDIISLNGLEVVNIKDVTNPQHEVFVQGGKLNKDLVVSGTRVFMAGAFYGIYIFDLEQYFASGGPVKVTTLTYKPSHGKMNCYDVDIDGNLLYVADYYNGLEVFDWTKKNQWLGECYNEISGNPTGVACDGDWAYMTTLTGTSGGYLYVVDVSSPDFDMKPYASYDNDYGAVSPDAVGTRVGFVSGREAPLASYTIERTAESLADMITPEWIGHYEITPDIGSGPCGMFGGWITIEGDYAYVMGRGYTVTKYDISDPTSISEVAHSVQVDQGYSAEIYGDYIYVAGKRGVWKIRTSDLANIDTSQVSQIWGQIAIHFPYAIVFGMNTPNPPPDYITRKGATYDISTSDVSFIDSKIFQPSGSGQDPAYVENWYYFGLTDKRLARTFIIGGINYIDYQSILSTRSNEWWSPEHSVSFIPHSSSPLMFSCAKYDLKIFLSDGHFHPAYGCCFIGLWCSASGSYDGRISTHDFNHFESTTVEGDFLVRHGSSWEYFDYYTYGTYYSSPPDYNKIRTHFMDYDGGENYYWAVWDEEGIGNSDRFPLWYARIPEYTPTTFQRIVPTHPSWGDFEDMNVIHFAINGPDKLFLITKRTGELHYYIDVIRVADMLCAGGLAKRNIHRNLKVPKTSKITISPNPFNTRCQIKIELPKDEQVNLEIYDTNGKNIYNKNFGELCEGLHNFNWNGKTEYGKSLPSGIYFINITMGAERKITKVILMK